MNNNAWISAIGSGLIWTWTCCIDIVLGKIPLSNQDNETPCAIHLDLDRDMQFTNIIFVHYHLIDNVYVMFGLLLSFETQKMNQMYQEDDLK